jgi:hypothetical protein
MAAAPQQPVILTANQFRQLPEVQAIFTHLPNLAVMPPSADNRVAHDFVAWLQGHVARIWPLPVAPAAPSASLNEAKSERDGKEQSLPSSERQHASAAAAAAVSSDANSIPVAPRAPDSTMQFADELQRRAMATIELRERQAERKEAERRRRQDEANERKLVAQHAAEREAREARELEESFQRAQVAPSAQRLSLFGPDERQLERQREDDLRRQRLEWERVAAAEQKEHESLEAIRIFMRNIRPSEEDRNALESLDQPLPALDNVDQCAGELKRNEKFVIQAHNRSLALYKRSGMICRRLKELWTTHQIPRGVGSLRDFLERQVGLRPASVCNYIRFANLVERWPVLLYSGKSWTWFTQNFAKVEKIVDEFIAALSASSADVAAGRGRGRGRARARVDSGRRRAASAPAGENDGDDPDDGPDDDPGNAPSGAARPLAPIAEPDRSAAASDPRPPPRDIDRRERRARQPRDAAVESAINAVAAVIISDSEADEAEDDDGAEEDVNDEESDAMEIDRAPLIYTDNRLTDAEAREVLNRMNHYRLPAPRPPPPAENRPAAAAAPQPSAAADNPPAAAAAPQPPAAADNPPAEDPPLDPVRICAICGDPLYPNEMVCVPRCLHMVHRACMADFLLRTPATYPRRGNCPSCRAVL